MMRVFACVMNSNAIHLRDSAAVSTITPISLFQVDFHNVARFPAHFHTNHVKWGTEKTKPNGRKSKEP